MASAGTGGSLPPNFLLTPQQQNLLFAALNSNKQQQPATQPSTRNDNAVSPETFKNSLQSIDKASAVQQSNFLDNYDYDFGDSSFDFSFSHDQTATQADNAGTIRSDSAENDGNDKRSHPDDEDDEDTPGNDAKRRESTEKIPKKPGRKPLTSEPSSKRKAQNRAAQRAFRERKEQHLKDLETKVDELEKASEAANHENSLLRAQVDQMTAELKQYRSRLTVLGNGSPSSRDKSGLALGGSSLGNSNDVNFQFEFPKFGILPNNISSAVNTDKQTSFASPISPQQTNTNASSPARKASSDKFQQPSQSARELQFKEDLAKFSGLFSPSMSTSTNTGSHGSVDSGSYSAAGTISSPSSSSQSNQGGPSSSCGTSPEPFTQSPLGFKPMDKMGTIGEEHPAMSTSDQSFAQLANFDMSSTNFDWLAQQNGGQFDPQLFNDYREPHDNILSNPSFNDFFNDAWDNDFFTPYNVNPVSAAAPKKVNLIDQIDASKESPEAFTEPKQTMSCNQIWEKLQACPTAQSGEFDLDGLCSELTKKAKCSGSGPVVQEQDFQTILNKFMGKDVSSSCTAESLGLGASKV